MGRPIAQIGEQADRKAIRERLKNRGLEGWQRQRLQAVLLACDPARTLPEIAVEVGAHRSTVTEWLRVARTQGWKALLDRQPKGKGPESWLTKESEERLKAKLDEGQLRRGEDARKWLEKEMGCKLSLVVVYKYLGKCEARLKVPRSYHIQQKPEAVDTFRKTLRDQLLGKNVPLEEKVHIWVIDEPSVAR